VSAAGVLHCGLVILFTCLHSRKLTMRFSGGGKRAPHSSIADTTGVSSILLPLRHKVMTSHCGLLKGNSAPGGGARFPFYLVEDVVAY